jgi:hypothetical protein
MESHMAGECYKSMNVISNDQLTEGRNRNIINGRNKLNLNGF